MRPEKIAIAGEIKAALESSDYAILVNHNTMAVGMSMELRKRLREKEATAKVVKNTLLGVAAGMLGMTDAPFSTQTGPTTMITGGELTGVAKLLKDFVKEYKVPELKGGALNGQVLTPAQIEALADLPSREVLLAMVLGTMAAPMTQLVGVMSQKICSLLYVLQAAAEKKAEG